MSRFDKYTQQPETESVISRFAKYVTPDEPTAQGDAGGAVRAGVYGLAGGAIPFGNTITSGIGAGIAKAAEPFTGDSRSYSELYDQAQADTKATQEAHPVATTVGNIAGIASTIPLSFSKTLAAGEILPSIARGPVNAIPKALSKVGNFVGRGEIAASPAAGIVTKSGVGAANTVLRGVKGALVAAPTGFAYGAGDAPDGQRLESGMQGAADAALIGGGASAALPVAGAALGYGIDGIRNIYKGINARDVEALDGAAQQIKAGSSRAYDAMRQNGAVFKQQSSDNIVSKIENSLMSDGPLNQGLHGKTISVIDDLRTAAQSPDFSLEKVDQWRQLLGQIAGNRTPDNLQDARKASIAIDALDSAVDNIQPQDLVNGTPAAITALNIGRSEYARARKFENITDIIRKSDGDANMLKRELKKFADNSKKTRGFNPAEINALQDASRQSGGEGLLKMLGKFGFDVGSARAAGNTALPALALSGIAGGSVAGGPGTAALAVAGTAARQGQKWIARAKAEDLLKIIEAGGQVSQKQIMNLPPAQGKLFMQTLQQMPPAAAKAAIILDKDTK